MQKSTLLAAIQAEIQRHDFSHFIDEPPSIAESGKGVVVAGCPACRNRINTMSQFWIILLATRCLLCWIGCQSSSEESSRGGLPPFAPGELMSYVDGPYSTCESPALDGQCRMVPRHRGEA